MKEIEPYWKNSRSTSKRKNGRFKAMKSLNKFKTLKRNIKVKNKSKYTKTYNKIPQKGNVHSKNEHIKAQTELCSIMKSSELEKINGNFYTIFWQERN